jgi:hypothetical protein
MHIPKIEAFWELILALSVISALSRDLIYILLISFANYLYQTISAYSFSSIYGLFYDTACGARSSVVVKATNRKVTGSIPDEVNF